MADYKVLVPFILHWEGGFVNDPHDRGGATNKGVTMVTWKNYCRKKGLVASVDTLKKITSEQWNEIFKTQYWDKMKADRIEDQSIANLTVDWVWHSGTKVIRKIQRIVGVDDDGIVGSKTIAAINSAPAITLFWKLHKARLAFYDSIAENNPSQKRYIRGWYNRVNSIEYERFNYKK